MAWQVEAVGGGVRMRAAAGPWIHYNHFGFDAPAWHKEAEWPDAIVDRDPRGRPWALGDLSGFEALQFDYDLLAGSQDELRWLIGNLVDEEIAEVIAALAAETPERAHENFVIPPVITHKGYEVPWMTMPVGTVTPFAGWHIGVRPALVFVAPTWLITVWPDFLTSADEIGSPEPDWDAGLVSLGRSLPSFRTRMDSDATPSGQELLMTRLLPSAVAHNLSQVADLENGLVRWEAEFLADHSSLAAIRAHGERLARIGRGIACVDYAAYHLKRRLEKQPVLQVSDGESFMGQLVAHRERLSAARGEARELFTLMGQAISAEQAALSEAHAVQTRRFEIAAALVTAFVLVPGLIIGFYSANVQGLPGQDATKGLVYMGLGALASGLLTIGVLFFLLRSHGTVKAEEDTDVLDLRLPPSEFDPPDLAEPDPGP